MKSTIKKKTYRAIYRLLGGVSPLPDDCGKLCGAACCCPETEIENNENTFSQEEMGIYLLPGEEKLFTRKENWLKWTVENAEDFDFPPSWHGKIYFVRCNCAPCCPRDMRPLQCRFFPVTPHLTESKKLSLIRSDLELPYTCPLLRDRRELTPSFLKATYTVWTHLIRDPLLMDLVLYDSSWRDDREIDVVYPNLKTF